MKASAIRIVVLIILATYFYRNVKLYEIILKNGIYIFKGNAAERNRRITLEHSNLSERCCPKKHKKGLYEHSLPPHLTGEYVKN
jgi:hypothetical protein